jgi:CDP-glycerol glycerophosphotransferase (TagB/SpsB family)
MFPNRDRLDRYVEAGLIAGSGPGAALVGYPKADALVDGSLDRDAIFADLRLDPTLPTVIYAPTWSPHSSLNAIGEEIIEGLAAAGYQVIAKLHDRSYDRETRGSGGIDWAARLDRYRHHPLVRVRQDADATPLLFACDALVTDHSSIGFEYMLLDRPIVVVDRPELLQHSRISPDKVRRLRAATDVVRTADEVREAVTYALAHPWRHSPERRATAEALFYCAGTATDRAVTVLYELLDLDAPAALGEATATPAVFEAVS